jgi:glycosyltransferase involved in cell wall biosynthesis
MLKVGAALRSLEFRLIRKRARRYGYGLQPTLFVRDSELFIENFFDTGFEKNALLSYLVNPFVSGIETHHSNYQECFVIAEILRELDYNVDIINWDNNSFLPQKKYDLVLDNHNNLERLNDLLPPGCFKIFHATNAYWLFQNSIEYERAIQYFLEKEQLLPPSRVLAPGNSCAHADAISMFGNKFTEKTYGKFADRVRHVAMSVTVKPEVPERNYDSAKLKFIWLNSHGVLLKGLDIIIDAFASLPKFTLHVCGNIERDSRYRDMINEQIRKFPNIIAEGWVDIKGDRFESLVRECAWVVSASFSEGGGGSVLNCMAKGMIPVITKSTSITLPEKTGFNIENNNIEEWANRLNEISKIENAALNKMANNAQDFIATNHTLHNFRHSYKAFLEESLRARNPNLVL